MRSAFVCLFLLGSMLFCLVAQGVSPEKPWLYFSADRYERDLARGVMSAQGNVHVTIGEDDFEADEIEIDTRQKILRARGHVKFVSGEDWLEADELVFHYGERKGTARNGILRAGQVTISAEVARKTDERTYEFENAQYTPCLDCPPSFSFSGSKTRVEEGEYVTINHAVLRLFSLPVFYLPFLVVPIKDERQSGFLQPHFGHSSRLGFNFELPFFIVLGRSHDATLAAKYMSRRGYRESGEYRYVLGEGTEGTFHGYLVQDRVFRDLYGRLNRYGAEADQRWKFGDHVSAKIQAFLLSDDRYVQDYTDLPGRAEAALESKAILTYDEDLFSSNLEATWFENLLSAHPLDNNQDTVQRIPAVYTGIRELHWPAVFPLWWGVDLDYAHYTTMGRTFVDRNGNGSFDFGSEQIFKAHRFDVRPRGELPLKIGCFGELLGRVSFRETSYLASEGDRRFGGRESFEYFGSYVLPFERVWSAPHGNKAWKHLVLPFVTYRYLPWIHQNVELPQFDEVDRIGRAHEFKYGVRQRLIAGDGRGEQRTYFEAADFSLSQVADLVQPERNRPGEGNFDKEDLAKIRKKVLSDVKGEMLIRFPWVNLHTDGLYNIYGDGLNSLSSAVSVNDRRGDAIALSYVYNRLNISHSLRAGVEVGFLKWLSGFYQTSYDFTSHQFLSKEFGASYLSRSKCWKIHFEGRENLDSTGVELNFGFIWMFASPDFTQFEKFEKYFRN